MNRRGCESRAVLLVSLNSCGSFRLSAGHVPSAVECASCSQSHDVVRCRGSACAVHTWEGKKEVLLDEEAASPLRSGGTSASPPVIGLQRVSARK